MSKLSNATIASMSLVLARGAEFYTTPDTYPVEQHVEAQLAEQLGEIPYLTYDYDSGPDEVRLGLVPEEEPLSPELERKLFDASVLIQAGAGEDLFGGSGFFFYDEARQSTVIVTAGHLLAGAELNDITVATHHGEFVRIKSAEVYFHEASDDCGEPLRMGSLAVGELTIPATITVPESAGECDLGVSTVLARPLDQTSGLVPSRPAAEIITH